MLRFRIKWGGRKRDTWASWHTTCHLNALQAYLLQTPSLSHLSNVSQHFAGNTTDDVTGQKLKYNSLINGPTAAKWEKAHEEEFDRLFVTNETMRLIHLRDKNPGSTISYYNPQCSHKVKDGNEVFRVRGTYGGDKSDFVGEKSSATAALKDIKIFANAVVSEEDAEFTTADIKDFFLRSKLKKPEYMWIPLSQIPLVTQIKYDVAKYAVNGRVLVEIVGGIYGHPQAGLLAHLELNAHLAEYGYFPAPNTRCLYKHIDRPIEFTLVVDDFGIKTTRAEHREHLLACLRAKYTITTGDGSKYVGISFDWDYTSTPRKVTLSMPNYIRKALACFGVVPGPPTHSPGGYVHPVYSRNQAPLPIVVPVSPLLPPARVTRLQRIVGTFLYYARAIDSTMLLKVNEIASTISKATELDEQAAEEFMQYAATWPNAEIVYFASDMVLHVQSDGSYLSVRGCRSRVGGFSYMGNKVSTPFDPSQPPSPINGAIEVRSTILDVVVASAMEAEYGGLFLNGKDAADSRLTLADLGYPQGPTPMQCDNLAAVGIANDSVKQRSSRAMDMRFHWIRDRVRQGQFHVFWREGRHNLADYFTKCHPTSHHRYMRRFFVRNPPLAVPPNTARSRRLQRRSQ